MIRRSSHHHEIERLERLGLWSHKRNLSIHRFAHRAVDAFIGIGSYSHQTITVTDSSCHLVLGCLEHLTLSIEGSEIYCNLLASLRDFQLDGIETIILRNRSCIRTEITILLLQHPGIKGAGIRSGLLAGITEIEVHEMTVAVEHLIIKLLLTHLILPLVGNNRVLSYFSLTIELGDAFQTMLLSPPLYHVWRMIDVVQMQIPLMGKLSEGIEMILLICYPVGIHSPEHPLGCHLEEATSSPGFARFVCHNLKLETVSQLVSQTVEFLILNTVRCYPERSDKVIVSSAVSSSFQRIVHHHHHLILVADAAW